MALLFVFLMFSVYSSLLIVSPQTVSPPDEIFILAGQSNMAGRGGVINETTWDGIVPPECSPGGSLILRLNANLTWEEAHELLHQGIDAGDALGVGPGIPFSHWLLQREPAIGVIGLVPSAVGGTNITQWAHGGIFYNKLITRAQTASQGGNIRAVLWYQGESDSYKEEDAMQYTERLIEFINNVRGDLGSPLMPFIQVALASGGEFLNVVRRSQLETCASLQNVACVDAMGLQLLGDKLHLTTPAQVQLGKMLANAFLDTIWLK